MSKQADTNRPDIKRDDARKVYGDAERLPRDLYALAYMCGGTSGLLTLYLYELVQKGYLVFVETKKWTGSELRLVAAQGIPPATELSDISGKLLAWFSEPQTAGDTYQRVFPQELKLHCLSYRYSLLQRQFLTGRLVPEKRNEFLGWAAGTSLVSMLVVGFLTDYPLIMDSITFILISIWIIMSLIIGLAVHSIIAVRLSAKGRQHVWRIKNKCDYLLEELRSAKLEVVAPDHRLAVAVFGASAINQKSFSRFLEPLVLSRAQSYGTENGAAFDGTEG